MSENDIPGFRKALEDMITAFGKPDLDVVAFGGHLGLALVALLVRSFQGHNPVHISNLALEKRYPRCYIPRSVS